MEPNIMTDVDAIKRFIFAGHSTFTLKSLASGEHRSFSFSKADDADRWFVKLLTKPDEWSYIGVCDGPQRQFRTTAKSKLSYDTPAVRALVWTLGHLHHGKLPDQLEFRHDGHCGRCHRQLTHPNSIDLGIGPECAEIMGIKFQPSLKLVGG